MNKELKLERVLHRRESIDISDIFCGSIANTEANLKEVMDRLKAEEKKNDYSVVFETEYHGYDGAFEVEAYVYRWETMKEYNKRLEKEAAAKEKAQKAAETKKAKAIARAMLSEADERELLAKLQEKYGVK